MRTNREKRDRIRRRLERQKQLAQEKLNEEQEKEALESLKREVWDLNNRRLVKKPEQIIANGTSRSKLTRSRPPRHRGPGRSRSREKDGDQKCKQNMFSRSKITRDDSRPGRTCAKALSSEEKIAKWLDSTVDSGSLLDESIYDTKCDVSCFSRKQVREQRKMAPTEPEKPATKKAEKKQKSQPKHKLEAVLQVVQPRQPSDDDSDGELVQSYWSFRTNRTHSTIKDKSRVRSGFLDKPRSCVMVKHEWPHMNHIMLQNH